MGTALITLIVISAVIIFLAVIRIIFIFLMFLDKEQDDIKDVRVCFWIIVISVLVLVVSTFTYNAL